MVKISGFFYVTTSLGIVNIGIGAVRANLDSNLTIFLIFGPKWATSAMTGSLFSFHPLVSCIPILQTPQYVLH